MPTFNVEVQIKSSDLLKELSDDDLIEEMEERGLPTNISDKRETLQLLKDCSNFLREHGKPAQALGLDDLISELDLV